MNGEPSGLARISRAFEQIRSEQRAALMPYYTLGYPDPDTSVQVVRSIAGAGADLLELGIPFSDPLADGPTIQHATQIALQSGMTVERSLALTGQIRTAGVQQPILLMGYYNPILSYGVDRFAAAANAAGADGFIVPDLPPEEAGEMGAACDENGCALVFLLAPNAADARIRTVAAATTGFLYLVSLTGVTGARAAIPPGLQDFVHAARKETAAPIAVGFGISTPAQAARVGELADGVIVGSALIQAVRSAREDGRDPAEAARQLVSALKEALVLR